MTDRATARHRAPSRVSTPLSTITTGLTLAVGDRMEALGRGGAVLAVSSGLVASIALPASAAQQQNLDLAGPQTASVPVGGQVGSGSLASVTTGLSATSDVAASDLVAGQGLLGTPAGLAADAPLAAPATATVTFEQGTLHATAAAPADQAAGRAQARASRSATRAALVATAKAAATPKAAAVRAGAPSASSTVPAAARGSAVLAVAARYLGVSYVFGGSDPSTGFDCSGYTSYVYRQLGISLPRTADQQLRATRRVSRADARPGDLVFFVYGGYASHVAIYAGDGMMYDSPRTGKSVTLRKIYSSSVVFGRVTA